MKLKLISDGTSRGTSIVNAETGEPLRGVVSIRWELDVSERQSARCEVSFIGMEAEFAGQMDHRISDVIFTIGPATEKVAG